MEGGAVNLYKDFFPTTLHLAPKINGNVWSLGTLAVLTVVLVFGMILGFLLATSIYDANFYATLWSMSMFSKSGKDHTSSVTSLLENSKYEVESGNRTALVSKKVPKHVAVIMDGNRRYGAENFSDEAKGHRQGGETLINFLQWCIEEGVQMATVYAFSTENWSRSAVEISTIMSIFTEHAERLKKEAKNKNIKVRILSTEFSRLPLHVQQALRELEEETKDCTKFIANICLSYGSRADITQAFQTLARRVAVGELAVHDVTEDAIAQSLTTASCPAPDILIRTSGEHRLSNFLLWELAYTEIFFVKKYWPQISQADLQQVFREYLHRDRRYGS